MKKLIITFILIAICSANAQDIVITFTIPEAHVQTFRTQFLAMYPVPLIDNPAYISDPNQPVTIPELTEVQHFKREIKRWVFKILRRGKTKLENEASQPVDPNSIE